MSRFPTIDLTQLPDMQVLEEISSEQIIIDRMLRLKEIWTENDPPAGAAYDVDNLEFDPLRIQAELATFFEMMLRDRVNQAARAITLAYAIGGDLEAVASRYPGGVPKLTDESDEHYRRRVWLSVNALSPHGTAEAYMFWALSALTGVLRDASSVKVRPRLEDNPVIIITCLLPDKTNPKPSTEQLLAIRAFIIDENRMGLTDVISVNAPKVIETDYVIQVWLFPGPDEDTILNAIQQSVDDLIDNQFWLGYDHTRAAIDRAVMLPGVANSHVVEPAQDIFVAPDWVVRVRQVTIQLMGRTE